MFHERTKRWFRESVGEPTQVQREAWPAIAAGESTLISAPTGTGKTLSAFLVWIDRLKSEAEAGTLSDGVQVIYISPLKSLAGDIRENLQRPLAGIGGPEVRTGLRTGDTTQAERQKMLRRPPHILITTPESLYLMLTSGRSREMLSTARAVIIDELHALISTKRGAHLMLSLARLDAICGRDLQRIGLSATIDPLELAAEYLKPDENVRVIAPKMEKRADIAVNGVLDDMRILQNGTIWPDLGRMVYAHCQGRRTVIAFLEGRQQAEKLAAEVNAIAGEGFALTHHGSISKEKRFEAEAALRSGRLRLLCATSSMELGIDVGDVDLVVQIGCPMTVSGALQRMGRAGHNPGRTSVMHIFPKTAADGLYCGLTAAVALEGGIEPANPPEMCFDVLAQHLVSMAVDGGYTVEDAWNTVRRAWPCRNVTREDVDAILRMLAGDWEHSQDKPVRARVVYDRINGTVLGDNYTRMLALSAGGTIPDRGLYPAVLRDGTRLGELDEEYVFEARVGEKFLLGAFAWRIDEIKRDRVIVSPASTSGAQPPFWKGDSAGRSYPVALRFGQLLRKVQQAKRPEQALTDMHMDAWAAKNAARHVKEQIEAAGCLPDDKTIVVEHFSDEAGDHQMMVHSVFGKRVNYGLALLLQRAASRMLKADVRAYDDDNGALLYLIGVKELPDGLVQQLDPESAERILTALLPATPLFFMAFRYNAARALLMGARSGKRQALWVQRLRGAEVLGAVAEDMEHPLMRETLRECLEDHLDMRAIREVLEGVRSGKIAVREIHLDKPSPMALPMRRAVEAEMLYDYHPIPTSAKEASGEALRAAEGIAPAKEALDGQANGLKKPENAAQLHELMMTGGDIAAGEVDAPIAWLEDLARAGRCLYVEPGLWIAAEEAELYRAALEAEGSGEAAASAAEKSGGESAAENVRQARLRIARRCLRYRGGQDEFSLSARYGWPEEESLALLEELASQELAVRANGAYWHREIYARAQRDTLMARRRAAETLPPERYAALLARTTRRPGRAEEQLKDAIEALAGRAFPLKMWEEQLLPARVNGYRPQLLDALLAKGEYFWQIVPGEKGLLRFGRMEDVDWDAASPAEKALEAGECAGENGGEPAQQNAAAGECSAEKVSLSDAEKTLIRALMRRGASFAHALAPLVSAPVIDILMSLAEKGLVRADSFVPLRVAISRAEAKNLNVKQLSRLRATAAQAGRWEIARPVRARSDEEKLLGDLMRAGVLCRETAGEVPWPRALEILRVWEYTGKVRRGYYVRSLSGAQFIREEDYLRITAALAAKDGEPVWLQANDPAQPWGSVLKHREGRQFICVPGTAVCLLDGEVIAILERKGGSLRVFGESAAALSALSRDFLQKRIFASLKKLVIKSGCSGLDADLTAAGFVREALDWVVLR